MAMIECSHLTMGYGSQIAVEDLSFSVEEGDYLCIVGPNGSGKSTLLKGFLLYTSHFCFGDSLWKAVG